ncbi:MAG: hypothetical protein ACOC22_00170 [bacterium]
METLNIDNTTYAISEINRYKVKSPKSQLVIANSLRKNNHHLIHLQHKELGRTKSWNTFTINREGKIFQHYNPEYHTDFLNKKLADKHIISIVLENMGVLFKTKNGKFVNWINEECDDKFVVEKKWLGYNYWEKYREIQIESLGLLCNMLCNKYNIPSELIEFQHYHKDAHKFRGIAFRSNHIQDSSDMNPLFSFNNLNKLLNNVSL